MLMMNDIVITTRHASVRLSGCYGTTTRQRNARMRIRKKGAEKKENPRTLNNPSQNRFPLLTLALPNSFVTTHTKFVTDIPPIFSFFSSSYPFPFSCTHPLILLDQRVKEGLQALCTLLGVPLLVVLVVDISDAEAGLVALGPLKVVHEGPGEVALDVDAVLGAGLRHGIHIIVEVLDAEVVLDNLLERHVVLALERGTVLGHVDLGVAVALAEPVEQVTEPLRVGTEPEGLRLGPDAVAVLVVEQSLEVAEEIVLGGHALLVLDVVGRVVVHAVEVVGALDERDFLGSELGQAVAELLAHRVGVLAEVDGVREPRDGELDLAVARLDVQRVLGVPGKGGVTVQGDADLATLSGLEVLTVSLDGAAVGDKEVVADDPGLASAVTNGRLGTVGGVAGGEVAGVVAEDGAAPGLVEGDPVLALGDGLEHDAGVVLKVEGELLAVQKTAIALVETIGKIPVEEGDEGGDAGLEEVVDELDVVVDALLVDGVVAATDGDDTGPRDGEAVGGGAERLEEVNVLLGAVVRVAGDDTRAAVSDLAGNVAEGIPDRRTTAISVDSTLNLIAVVRYVC